MNDPERVLAEAEKAGVDVMRLKRNLELTPDERLAQFLKALAWLEWASQARRKTLAYQPLPASIKNLPGDSMQPEALITAWNAHEVKYVIVGGFAAVLQGARYVTQDVDFCYARDEENLSRLLQALEQFHPIIRTHPAIPFDLPALRANPNFTLDTEVGELDLLAAIDGLGDYMEVVGHAAVFEVQGQSCHVLSLEGLIASKSVLKRRKDVQLLEELRALAALKKQDR